MYSQFAVICQGQNLEKNDLEVGENGLFRKNWKDDRNVNFPLAEQIDLNDDACVRDRVSLSANLSNSY